MNRRAVIYTDGSCHGNPGPGGYAAVVLLSNGSRLEVHGSHWHTTNNRMELTAVIQGLKLLSEPTAAKIVSDSRYVVNPISRGNLKGYLRNSKCKNGDLWEQVLRLSAFHTLTAEWVQGHAGSGMNELCDRLANKEARRVEEESEIRQFVFRELLRDLKATPEQIAQKFGYGAGLAVIRKYHEQYFEQLGRCQLYSK